MNCSVCGVPVNVELTVEFTRCGSCQAKHDELAKKLDSRPVPVKKPKEEFVEIKSIKRYQNPDGSVREVEFIDYHSKADWLRSGQPLPQ